MTIGRRFMVALLVALAVWTVFSWPLPQHVFSGIPSSDRNVEKNQVRTMISGDHLQLLYHFQLAADMVSRKIPLFCNLYEFNTGVDADRYRPDPYYVPFSLVYALGAWLAGQAFGWNLAGFISILLTYFLTWELVRRYVEKDWISALAALVAFMFPYRWITLLSGSPTGFAMVFPPALLLGLDMAIRDQRSSGGVLAGAAVFLSYCTDLHVFFFSALIVPFWCLIAAAWWPNCCLPNRKALLRVVRALLPFVLLALAAVALSTWLQRFAGTDVAQGRSWEDVQRFSPRKEGLFSWQNLGVSNHVFFGAVVSVLLLSGLLLRTLAAVGLCPRWIEDGHSDMWNHPRRAVVFVLLCLGMADIVILALGVNGPFEGGAMRLCRTFVPRYDMIRQPVKTYSVLPSVMAVAIGLTVTAWTKYIRRKWVCAFLVTLALASVGAEYRMQVSPTICLLDREQKAYGAVAEAVARKNRAPRALVIPLWPGDSHYTSLNQYYAALYGIRMLNGYSPVIDENYFQSIFRRFESANSGVLSDEQLEALLAIGVEFVIFHENPFPEKVSPFPAGFTLKRLLNHGRLSLLEQDGSAWAFRILKEPEPRTQVCADWQFFAPSRLWEAERLLDPERDTPLRDAEASGDLFARLNGGKLSIRTGCIPLAPELRWLLRVRGDGRLRQSIRAGTQLVAEGSMTVTNSLWQWIEIPLPLPEDGTRVVLDLSGESGSVDLDLAILAGGHWPDLAAEDAAGFPAPCFFRAGYTDLPDNSVVLRMANEPDRAVFYGPNMPLPRGHYKVCMTFTSAAPDGTVLGRLRLPGEVRPRRAFDVISGAPCVMAFEREDNLPVRIDFVFARNADLKIHQVTLRRVRD